MIPAKEILQLVRFKQKDNNEILFSDYDIKNSLNEALRYIGQSQALQNSDFLLSFQRYNEDEINATIEEENQANPEKPQQPLINFQLDGVDLPADYQILSGINRCKDHYSMRPCDASCVPTINEYKIVGEKIYSGCRDFNLGYKKTLSTVQDIETDSIELPTFCTDLVVKITCMILNQAESDILLQTIDSTARAIVPRRRYNNAQTKMPFIV